MHCERSLLAGAKCWRAGSPRGFERCGFTAAEPAERDEKQR